MFSLSGKKNSAAKEYFLALVCFLQTFVCSVAAITLYHSRSPGFIYIGEKANVNLCF